MNIDSTNIDDNIQNIFDSSKELTKLIVDEKGNNSSLEKRNRVHREILNTLKNVEDITDYISGDLKRLERLHEYLSKMLSHYSYKSPDSGKE